MQRGDVFTEIVLETFKVSGLLTTEGDRLTEAHGLSSARWKILGSLARSSSPLTVSQIARIMGQARQSVQRLVDVMHKDEILNFINNPNHKRSKFVVLTAKGEDIYTNLNEIWNPWAHRYSKQLNEKELETTLATLKKIALLFKA